MCIIFPYFYFLDTRFSSVFRRERERERDDDDGFNQKMLQDDDDIC